MYQTGAAAIELMKWPLAHVLDPVFRPQASHFVCAGGGGRRGVHGGGHDHHVWRFCWCWPSFSFRTDGRPCVLGALARTKPRTKLPPAAAPANRPQKARELRAAQVATGEMFGRIADEIRSRGEPDEDDTRLPACLARIRDPVTGAGLQLWGCTACALLVAHCGGSLGVRACWHAAVNVCLLSTACALLQGSCSAGTSSSPRLASTWRPVRRARGRRCFAARHEGSPLLSSCLPWLRFQTGCSPALAHTPLPFVPYRL